MDDYDIGDVILDRYEVTDVLGEGGMGYVLAAQDRRLERLVALKFLLTHLHAKPLVAARFEREARTATRIDDEHVARVHNVEVTAEGVPFIVMEYLRGDTLAAILRARGSLPLAEAVDLLLQGCEAIAQAHKLGIIHRDLKPSNLFLTKAFDGTPLLKVLDFGIAKALSSNETSLTATDGLVGTAAYMSPEQISAGDIDGRSDVWALGVILYELVAGEPPFTGPSTPFLGGAILAGRYAPLATHRPEIPAAFEDALAETLAVDPEERLASVEAFAARFAPFGTDLARASHARIRRIASATEEPTEAPRASTDPSAARAVVGPTSADHPTSITQDAPEPSPPPRPQRTLQAALGVAAFTAVAFGVARYHATPAPSSAAAPPLESAPVASAVASAPAPVVPADGSACAAGATPACEAACAAHLPGSCRELAKALVKGVGAPQDLARAAALFQADCDAGSGDSCNRLGGLYARGEGVAQDDAKALGLYETGCGTGSVAACVNEGSMLYEGKGGRRDEAAAVSLFQSGCDGGEPLGCVNLSAAYHDGRGVPKDLARAYELAQRACADGALAGCTRVALAKVRGEGVAKDVKGGLAALDALCKRGETTACNGATGFYAKGHGTDVAADSARVRDAVQKGCAAGSKSDCQAKSTLHTLDRTSASNAIGWGLFEKQCDAGTMSSCRMLGDSLVSGSWGVTDRPRGMALLDKACKGGDAPACKLWAGAGGR